MKAGIAFFVVMASVVGGGSLFSGWIRFPLLCFDFLTSFPPEAMIGAMVSWIVLVGSVAGSSSSALPTTNFSDLSSLWQIWNPSGHHFSGRSRPFRSFLLALWSSEVFKVAGGVVFVRSRRFGGRPSFNSVVMVVSGGVTDQRRRLPGVGSGSVLSNWSWFQLCIWFVCNLGRRSWIRLVIFRHGL